MIPRIPAAARRTGARRLEMYRREIAQRAGLYYRLGYPQAQAVVRVRANLDWDFELGTGGRPPGLTDTEIAAIVAATYARRPTR